MSRPQVSRQRSPLRGLTHNAISILGIVVAGSSGFAAVCLMAIDAFRGYHNPYLGVLTYLVAPGFLLIGLSLVAIGAIRQRHALRHLAPDTIPRYPHIDLNVPRERRVFLTMAIGTIAFLVLTAVGTYHSYQFTESVAFCGLACHEVMRPEYTAYLHSPHARVACTACHIGPGATWYVKSKLSGAYQVFATLTHRYPRPIPAPIRDLRPAQQTCEQCHWPRQFYGTAGRVIQHYLPDSSSTPWSISMLLKIGGGAPGLSSFGGIHWHMNIAHRIEYIASDSTRQVIPWVRRTDSDGTVTTYQSSEAPLAPKLLARATRRVMDCIDCHNRPTHIYSSPVQAVDLAISSGQLDRTLPYIRRQAVAVLARPYATTQEALRSIADSLTAYYRLQYPTVVQKHPGLIARAAAAVQRIFTQDFFPEMGVDWRTYPDNVGHLDFPGCFRCHDGLHVSPSGKVISRDCRTCHAILAQGPSPGLGTTNLDGLDFAHPVDVGGAWKDNNCSMCHTGANVD